MQDLHNDASPLRPLELLRVILVRRDLEVARPRKFSTRRLIYLERSIHLEVLAAKRANLLMLIPK